MQPQALATIVDGPAFSGIAHQDGTIKLGKQRKRTLGAHILRVTRRTPDLIR